MKENFKYFTRGHYYVITNGQKIIVVRFKKLNKSNFTYAFEKLACNNIRLARTEVSFHLSRASVWEYCIKEIPWEELALFISFNMYPAMERALKQKPVKRRKKHKIAGKEKK